MTKPEAQAQAPDRIFVQVLRDGDVATYRTDPREVHDNGKPVYEYVRADAPRATPPAGETLTVEACLAELRQMFPDEHDPAIGKFISVKRQDFIDSNHAEVSQTVHVYIGYGQSPPSCSAQTLDEAMNQVRAWAKSRAESKGE